MFFKDKIKVIFLLSERKIFLHQNFVQTKRVFIELFFPERYTRKDERMMGPFSKILHLRNKAGAFRQGDGPNRYNNYERVDLRTVPHKIVGTAMDTITAMVC